MKRKSLRRKVHSILHQLPSCPDTAYNAAANMAYNFMNAVFSAPKKTVRRRRKSVA